MVLQWLQVAINLAFLLGLFGSIQGRPQHNVDHDTVATFPQDSSVSPIPIISFTEVMGDLGNFNYSFETGNGIKSEQTGYTKVIQLPDGVQADEGSNNPIQVLSGSYSYQAPDGTIISLSYIADENGFQPVGDHLPTPPPIPESIQRVLEALQRSNATNTDFDHVDTNRKVGAVHV